MTNTTTIPNFYVSGLVLINDETVKAAIRSLNLKPLGSGVSRTAYALSDTLVIKVRNSATNYYGSCDTEAQVWEKVRDTDDADYFAPVVASGRNFSIMARVCCVGRSCPDCHNPDGHTFGDLMDVTDRLRINDMHGGNWGTLPNGNIVAIDYAMNALRHNGSSGSMRGNWSEQDVSDQCECDDCLRDRCEACINGDCCTTHDNCQNGRFCGCRINPSEMCDFGSCQDNACESAKVSTFRSIRKDVSVRVKNRLWVTVDHTPHGFPMRAFRTFGTKRGIEAVWTQGERWHTWRPMCAMHANRDRRRNERILGHGAHTSQLAWEGRNIAQRMNSADWVRAGQLALFWTIDIKDANLAQWWAWRIQN